MTVARWLLLAPALWLAFVYLLHSNKEPGKAVLGWTLIFAPYCVAIGIAEVWARIEEWRRYGFPWNRR
jgi:hypothetical protein